MNKIICEHVNLTELEFDDWRDNLRSNMTDELYHTALEVISNNRYVNEDELHNWMESMERNVGFLESIESSIRVESYEEYLERQ